jgi:hypothetical protein
VARVQNCFVCGRKLDVSFQLFQVVDFQRILWMHVEFSDIYGIDYSRSK